MLKHVLEYLSPKPEPRRWGFWLTLPACEDCGWVRKPTSAACVAFDSGGRVCPSCGGKHITKVVARWEESDETKRVGFANVRTGLRKFHRVEIHPESIARMPKRPSPGQTVFEAPVTLKEEERQ